MQIIVGGIIVGGIAFYFYRKHKAKEDEVLGMEHFDLARRHLSDVAEIHVVGMPHTSRVDSVERREIVEGWMVSQLGEVSQ